MDLIPAFVTGLLFGLGIGVPVGLAIAAWTWLDGAYRHGLEDSDARWKRSFDDVPHCRAIPLTPREAGK